MEEDGHLVQGLETRQLVQGKHRVSVWLYPQGKTRRGCGTDDFRIESVDINRSREPFMSRRKVISVSDRKRVPTVKKTAKPVSHDPSLQDYITGEKQHKNIHLPQVIDPILNDAKFLGASDIKGRRLIQPVLSLVLSKKLVDLVEQDHGFDLKDKAVFHGMTMRGGGDDALSVWKDVLE